MVRSWRAIIALWLCGVLAAAQLSKFSAAATLLKETYSLSYMEIGVLVSGLEIGGALLGIVAGALVPLAGWKRLLQAGLTVMLGCSATEAVAASAQTLFVARGLESVGYLLVVVSAPTGIAHLSPIEDRSKAFGLWSSFMPIGLAIGSGATGALLSHVSVGAAFAVWAAVLGGALAEVRGVEGGTDERSVWKFPGKATVAFTLTFGTFTMLSSAAAALLPSFMVERHALDLWEANAIASAGFVLSVGAIALAMKALAREQLRGGRLVVLSVCGFSVMATSASALFDDGLVAGKGASALLAIAVIVSGAVVSPFLFGRLPDLVGNDSEWKAKIAAANGMLAQCGAAGALVGPPAAGWLVDRWGWRSLGPATLVCAVLLVSCIAAVELMTRGRRADGPSTT